MTEHCTGWQTCACVLGNAQMKAVTRVKLRIIQNLLRLFADPNGLCDAARDITRVRIRKSP